MGFIAALFYDYVMEGELFDIKRNDNGKCELYNTNKFFSKKVNINDNNKEFFKFIDKQQYYLLLPIECFERPRIVNKSESWWQAVKLLGNGDRLLIHFEPDRHPIVLAVVSTVSHDENKGTTFHVTTVCFSE